MSCLDFNNTAGHYTHAPAVNVANLTRKFIDDANAKADRFCQRRIHDDLKPARHDLRHKPLVSAVERVVNDYSKWTKSELTQSLVARGIKTEARCQKLNKHTMIAALQRADRHPRFSRFLDSPPELRNQIYKLTIDDLNPEGKAQERPPTPAISRVNREIRNETLPLFARNTCFSVTAGLTCETTFIQLRLRLPTQLSPAVTLKPFKGYTAHTERSGWLQDMRSFQWEVAGHAWIPDSGMTYNWGRRFYVQFSQDMKTVETRASEADGTNHGHLEKVQAKLARICVGHSTTMTGEVLRAMMTVFEAYVANVDSGLDLDEEFWKA